MTSYQTMQGRSDPLSPSFRKQHYKQTSQKVQNSEERIARGLGWFSIGLGLAELITPGKLGKAIGVKNHGITMRVLGLREITSGIGIFSKRRPAEWLWSRVIGDFMDLALLTRALASNKSRKGRVVAATAAVVGVTALDISTARRLSTATGQPADTVFMTRSITVNRSPEDLYRFWRDFQNLPRFMRSLESVQITGEKRSHWVGKAIAGKKIEWDSEILSDVPNEVIAWRSAGESDFEHAGSVQFISLPSGRGTKVMVEFQYKPLGGPLGATIAKLFGKVPDEQLQQDLRRFKQLMETGEVATTEGQPSGERGALNKLFRKFKNEMEDSDESKLLGR